MERNLLDCGLELTIGMIAHAATLADERISEILAQAGLPPAGYTRDVRRQTTQHHGPCGGLGVVYEIRHHPLCLVVRECACVRYEVLYTAILIDPSHHLEEATH